MSEPSNVTTSHLHVLIDAKNKATSYVSEYNISGVITTEDLTKALTFVGPEKAYYALREIEDYGFNNGNTQVESLDIPIKETYTYNVGEESYIDSKEALKAYSKISSRRERIYARMQGSSEQLNNLIENKVAYWSIRIGVNTFGNVMHGRYKDVLEKMVQMSEAEPKLIRSGKIVEFPIDVIE